MSRTIMLVITVRTRELDGEHLDVDPAAFDAVICRLGLMYFPDQPGALAAQYRALRTGGRISAIVFNGGPQWLLLDPPGARPA